MSSNKTQAVPANVTIAAGQTTGTADVTTQPVATSTAVTHHRHAQRHEQDGQPHAERADADRLSPKRHLGAGRQTLTATAVISSAAPAGGITVTMIDDKTQATAANIVVAAGQTQGSASVTTQGVTTNTTVTVTGTLSGVSKAATFTITKTTLASIYANPDPVRGGNNTNVTVTLNGVAPTGGITVATGDNSGNVGMPSSVFIPAGASSVTITIATATSTRTRSSTSAPTTMASRSTTT
jgi:hypothetical protein